MVKIRLRRVGATKRPMYRIVAADSHMPRDGRFLETLGHYHPLTKPATVVINQERLQHWLSVGAQPTDIVQRLIKRAAEAPAEAPVEAAATPARATRRPRAAAKAEGAPVVTPAEARPVAEAATKAPVAEAATKAPVPAAETKTPEETP